MSNTVFSNYDNNDSKYNEYLTTRLFIIIEAKIVINFVLISNFIFTVLIGSEAIITL